MTKFNWRTYRGGILIEDPNNYETTNLSIGPILIANCFSKNGYFGACVIIKTFNGYVLEAGSNDTGKSWKSPDNIYPTVIEAVNKAEEIWRRG